MSVNKVILVGRLGQNPETRVTPGGASVANFSIATNESWTDKSGQKQERTEWHKVVVWGKQAELCSQYLTKGRQVYLEGRLQTRQWQDKEGQTRYTTEVHAQVIQFLGTAGAQAGGQYTGPQGGVPYSGSQGNGAYTGATQFGGGEPSSRPAANGEPSFQGSFAGNLPPSAAPGATPSFTEEDVPF